MNSFTYIFMICFMREVRGRREGRETEKRVRRKGRIKRKELLMNILFFVRGES